MYPYSLIQKKILYICRYEYTYFFNKSNVVALGLGYKVKNGIISSKECISIFVNNKLSLHELLPNDIIPSTYNGVITDVIDSGPITASSLTNKIRPALGGYSIGPIKGAPGGTFGCLVTDGKYYHVLTNNHIIVDKKITKIGMPIIQPTVVDGGTIEDEIAKLSLYIPLKPQTSTSSPENLVDCSINKITKRSLVSTKIAFLGRPKGTALPYISDDVMKVGRTSELTKGSIISIGATAKLTIDEAKYLFVNQIITTRMSSDGDSGSVLFDKNINAIGLLVGASNSQSLFNPIDAVLDSLKVKIVTGD
ncbi:hypothetical protein G8S49_07715 [Clostridium botulinum C]|uniref:Trypsin-like serine protease n=3 Tax=Clostridium botulinum TaxID=1491 RepID=A0A9Q4TGB7_CLOBO|nr:MULTISPECIES: hypothetical protein [Clostridium]AYF53702.1 hypothetical protein DFH04_02490 [Clostridium novyi]EES90871.1 conserved hypothetical protein [Clostridium botulinum D str. 1873]MCD3195126.1 hypothetical protein [Clostridium botulinum C]MCD3200466.1 hypothetical protein [Clostridium botulinum C]MCD3205884.1 hypothetical protein [Clostridium botulinum C]